jgi:mannose-6-phosphate isomerase-like protein (cupin superfamily)
MELLQLNCGLGFLHYSGRGRGYKIKRIEVKPGHRLSLQMHYHRSEHWIVVSGTAKVLVAITN